MTDNLVLKNRAGRALLRRRGLVLSRWHGRTIQGVYFGTVPESRRSRRWDADPVDGIEILRSLSGEEVGLSVFPVRERRRLRISDEHARYAIAKPATAASLAGRPAYLVRGKVVGLGADGEPLLGDVKIIREIRPEEITFQAGQRRRG